MEKLCKERTTTDNASRLSQSWQHLSSSQTLLSFPVVMSQKAWEKVY